jgi:undecaprenyl-diphosphatase
MSDIAYSIIAGIIQGLTEFLPVSSSGHLIFFHAFFGFNFADNLAFDVVMHLGTMAAVLAFFLPELLKYFFAGLQSFRRFDLKGNKDQRLAWGILIASIPAALLGYFLEDQIEFYFRNVFLVAVMMIVFGLLLLLADKFASQKKNIGEITLADSFIIGLSQALALFPGVSRSAITIIAGLSRKLKRPDAARFSFLASAPVVIGAGLKKTLDLFSENILSGSDLTVLAAGFFAAAITGYLGIKYFLLFLNNHSLKVFAYYRIILGAVVIIGMVLWKI